MYASLGSERSHKLGCAFYMCLNYNPLLLSAGRQSFQLEHTIESVSTIKNVLD